MIACPHCGTQNSAQKRVCYHCQAELDSSAHTRDTVRQRKEKSAKDAEHPGKGRYTANDYIFGVTLRQRAQVYRQLHSLLNSGIPLGLALGYCAQNCAFQIRNRLKKLADHVQQGKSLSEGMREYPILFPDWECNVVMAAEKSGTLPQAMADIAETIEIEWDLRSRTFVSTLHLRATLLVFVLVAFILASVRQGSVSDVMDQVGQAFIRFCIFLAALIAIKQA
jgi:type II secretory pathway component PulF